MKDEAIGKLIEYLEQSKDFVLSEAPDILQQMIKYETISSLIGILVFGILMMIGISIIIFHVFFSKKDLIPDNLGAFLSILLTPLILIGFLVCADNFIKLKYAPKYYILEKLIKKGK